MERQALINKVGTVIQPIAGLKEALEENIALQCKNPGQIIETSIIGNMYDEHYEASARLMASGVPTEFASFRFLLWHQEPHRARLAQ